MTLLTDRNMTAAPVQGPLFYALFEVGNAYVFRSISGHEKSAADAAPLNNLRS